MAWRTNLSDSNTPNRFDEAVLSDRNYWSQVPRYELSMKVAFCTESPFCKPIPDAAKGESGQRDPQLVPRSTLGVHPVSIRPIVRAIAVGARLKSGIPACRNVSATRAGGLTATPDRKPI